MNKNLLPQNLWDVFLILPAMLAGRIVFFPVIGMYVFITSMVYMIGRPAVFIIVFFLLDLIILFFPTYIIYKLFLKLFGSKKIKIAAVVILNVISFFSLYRLSLNGRSTQSVIGYFLPGTGISGNFFTDDHLGSESPPAQTLEVADLSFIKESIELNPDKKTAVTIMYRDYVRTRKERSEFNVVVTKTITVPGKLFQTQKIHRGTGPNAWQEMDTKLKKTAGSIIKEMQAKNWTSFDPSTIDFTLLSNTIKAPFWERAKCGYNESRFVGMKDNEFRIVLIKPVQSDCNDYTINDEQYVEVFISDIINVSELHIGEKE